MGSEVVFLAVLGAGAVATLGAWAYRTYLSKRGRLRRALRKAPTVTVTEAPDGQPAKLVGVLRYSDAQPLEAPLTRRRCACYQVTVQERGGNNNWRTVIDASDHLRSFWLEDRTGRALVQLELPSLLLTMDAHFRSGFLDDAAPALEAFLAQHGRSSRGLVFNKTLRYREGVLEEGEEVAVFGLCRWEPDPEPGAGGGGYRETPMRLRVVAPPKTPMVVSDEQQTLV